MDTGLLIGLTVILLLVLILWFLGGGVRAALPSRKAGAHSPHMMSYINRARLSDLQRLYDLVADAAHDDAWVLFMPEPARHEQTEVVHLQFALANGRPGFEWVLLAPVNLKDRASFEKLADSMGIDISRGRLKSVEYLRTEDERSVDLCRRILIEMYGADESTTLDLVFDKHEWTWDADPVHS